MESRDIFFVGTQAGLHVRLQALTQGGYGRIKSERVTRLNSAQDQKGFCIMSRSEADTNAKDDQLHI